MAIDSNIPIVYTHTEFVSDIKNLANDILASKWIPDLIVGVVRGGCVPAVYLSHKLKTPMVTINCSLRDAKTGGFDPLALLPVVTAASAGKKVLIVDDIVDGGDTIAVLRQEIAKIASERVDALQNVRVTSLWFNPSQTQATVDYYANTMDRAHDPRWVVFPWEAV